MVRVCQYLASIVQNIEHSLLLLVTCATDLSLRAIKCCFVVFGVTLRLLVTHFVVVSRYQQTRPLLPATSVINLHVPSQLCILHLPLEWFAARNEANIGS